MKEEMETKGRVLYEVKGRRTSPDPPAGR
jgi:hypothetical protein